MHTGVNEDYWRWNRFRARNLRRKFLWENRIEWCLLHKDGWIDGWMDGASIHMHAYRQTCCVFVCGSLVRTLAVFLSLCPPFFCFLSPFVGVWVRMLICMCADVCVRWRIALDSIQKYHRPWPVFSYCPLFSELPICHLLLFFFFFFPWICYVYMYTAAVCAAYQIASLISIIYISMFVCVRVLELCIEKFSQFFLPHRFPFFSVYTSTARQENHFINCQLDDEYIGIVLSLHIWIKKLNCFSHKALRNSVTIVALIFKFVAWHKRQNDRYENRKVCNIWW